MMRDDLPICSICKQANAIKAVQSVVRNYLHGVCEECGEEEYQLSIGKGTRETVSARQRASTVQGERRQPVTFTLRKMSGKGIRMVARYLAVLKLGGSLDDTPEQFYERFEDAKQQSRRECERAFTAVTDEFEERLRDEEGFLSSNRVQDVASFVQRKLGEGMWIDAEVTADHLREGATVPAKRGVARPSATGVSSNDVNALVKRLKSETDPVLRRKLRRQLRKMGHRGGAREE